MKFVNFFHRRIIILIVPTSSPIHPGFFPAEMVFTERAIPTLVAAGIEWVIVANNHISRSCKVTKNTRLTWLSINKISVVFVLIVLYIPQFQRPILV